MARFVCCLPLFLLFVATTLASPQSAQTPPAKPPTQGAKKQSQSATKHTQPAKTQATPTPTPPKPVGGPANATDEQGQSAAKQDQPASEQPKPASTPTQPSSNQAPEITGVNVFQTAATQDGDSTYYLEISGKSLPTSSAVIFLAPQQKLTGQAKVVSAADALIVAKFTASKDYFPSTVGIAGTDGVIKTFDLDKNKNPNLLKIDDVEVLQLDRKLGIGSIKVDGANFGTDPSKISVAIVPRDPGLPAFARVAPRENRTTTDQIFLSCPAVTAGQQKTSPVARTPKDDIVVVDFSFPCMDGYSAPFVIARVLVTVTDKDGKTSTASYEAQPARDKNLTYRSTILSQKQASSRFGGGVARNFYAVQLSIVNKGSVKIQVPLASIQAEVEWFAGQATKKYYREGPPTVAPVPLAGAVSYFSTHRQSTGARAIVFNSLQGLTTMGSAIQLFFGPGFAQGVGIAGGGFRQGLGQIFQDTSEQQLANLTSQSFESIETVSGNGGSIEKVIFIQRREEVLEPGKFDEKVTKFSRLIDNILGFEITGYQVLETPAKTATPQ